MVAGQSYLMTGHHGQSFACSAGSPAPAVPVTRSHRRHGMSVCQSQAVPSLQQAFQASSLCPVVRRICVAARAIARPQDFQQQNNDNATFHPRTPSELRNGQGLQAAGNQPNTLHTVNTRRIKLCSDWLQLKRVVDTHGSQFNHMNIAAAMGQLAHYGPGPIQPAAGSSSKADASAWDAYASYEALLQKLLQMTSGAAPQMGARQIANCVWAAAKVGGYYTGGHPLCRTVVEQLMSQQGTYLLPWSNAQELSISIWAAASLQLWPGDDWLYGFLNASVPALDNPSASPQDLATILWALSMLGVLPDDEWMESYVARVRERTPDMTHRDSAQVLAAMARLRYNLNTTDPQLVATLRSKLLETDAPASHRIHTTGQGGRRSDIHTNNRAMASTAGLQDLETQHWCISMSQGLWALASMSAVPPTAWMKQALQEVESSLHQFLPHELSTCLWAIVTLGQPLPTSLVRSLYNITLQPASGHHSMNSVTVSSNLISSEALEPPQEIKPGFTPHILAEMIWAISVADQSFTTRSGVVSRPLTPPATWINAFLSSVLEQLPAANEQSVSMILLSLARLKITPPDVWMSRVLTHITVNLRDIQPHALSNSIWAIAKLGYKVNAEGMAALEQQLYRSLSGHNESEELVVDEVHLNVQGHNDAQGWGSQELSNTLYAMAKWNHRPDDEVLQPLLGRLLGIYASACTTHTAMKIQPQELANTLWALGQLQIQPSEAWLGTFWAAASMLMSSFNAKDISQIMYALAKLQRYPDASAVTSADLLMQRADVSHLLDEETARAHQRRIDAVRNAYVHKQPDRELVSHTADHKSPSPERVTASVSALPYGIHIDAEEGVDFPTAQETAKRRSSSPETSNPHEKLFSTHQAGQASIPTSLHTMSDMGGSVRQEERVPAWAAGLLQEAATTFSKCKGQDLANLTWGLVQLGIRPSKAWCACLATELASRGGSGMTGSHLSLCIWALGKLGHQPAPGSLSSLEGAMFRRLPSLSPRELAACISGFAAMEYALDPDWLEAFANQCIVMASQFTQQDWSVVVYSLAAIIELDPAAELCLEDLFLSPQLSAQIDNFEPRGLAILLYAFSMLGAKSPKLVKQLLSAATVRMSGFTGPELSSLIMACVRLGAVPDHAFFAAWTQQMRNCMEAATVTNSSSSHTSSTKTSHSAQGFGMQAGHPTEKSNVVGLDSTGGTTLPAGLPSHLSGSVLAVSAWGLLQLKLRPKPSWLSLFFKAVQQDVVNLSLGHGEMMMLLLALGHWQVAVPQELWAGLTRLMEHHKPLLTAKERRSANISLKNIRKACHAAKQVVVAASKPKKGRSTAVAKDLQVASAIV